jgi:flagellar biosynthesis chaperone FliJ
MENTAVKRFDFRLERVLRLKKQLEHMAEISQQAAQVQATNAEAHVASLADQLVAMGNEMDLRVGQAEPIDAWRVRFEQGIRTGQALEAASGRARQAAQLLRDANARRARLATEVETLLGLRNQQWQAFARRLNRSEQEQLDELSLRRWRAAPAAASTNFFKEGSAS